MSAVQYCDFHPRTAATWHCAFCSRDYCDDCMDEGPDERPRDSCILCDGDLESLGHAFTAVPFWRRLQESFRYPLDGNAIAVIVGTAVVAGLAPLLLGTLIGLILALIATGVLVKYAFTCLKRTSEGDLKAPDVAGSFSGGIKLLFKLMAIGIVFGTLVQAGFVAVGPGFGMFLATVMVIVLPAVIIILALTESLFAALNPLTSYRLIRAIGLPYGLIQGFILIMFASVGLIQEMLAGGGDLPASVLGAVVSNYYTVVMFHIFGYMLFQYQGALGFVARGDDEDRPHRSPQERLQARVAVLVKDGRYLDARSLLAGEVKRAPGDRILARQLLEYLLATHDGTALRDYASQYFERALKRGDPDPLAPVYHRVRELAADYRPDLPEVRVALARQLAERGEHLAAVRLLNGLQKDFPEYAALGEAFHLMADSLQELPDMQAQAGKARALADRFGPLDIGEEGAAPAT
ncbi:MAG TPA: hypothetical protein VLA56_19365 [Pseudomonadales bacterium]|nr:hypothetical protein [Pseudomonadales bacterium]